MKKRKGNLLQRMMAVLLSAVLVTGTLWGSAPTEVLAQENVKTVESVSGNDMPVAEEEESVLQEDAEMQAAEAGVMSSAAQNAAGDNDSKSENAARYSTDGGQTWTEAEQFFDVIFPDGQNHLQGDVQIELLRDITLDGTNWTSWQQTFGWRDSTWILDGKGHTITRGEGVTMLFYVAEPNSKVILKDVIMDGGAVWEGDDPASRTNSGVQLSSATQALIAVGGTAELVLENGAILQNCDLGNHAFGPAVWIGYNCQPGDTAAGILTLKDGCAIRNNRAASGAGVCVYEELGVLNMEGGSIYGNYAYSDGGGVKNLGVFNMESGSIYGNYGVNNGGGVTNVNTFRMSGGEIRDNKGGAGGGGITAFGGNVTITGGSVTGNAAFGGTMGGGVLVYVDRALTLAGSPIIVNNTDKNGSANNVYLGSGKTLSISGALNNGAAVGVTTQNRPAEGAYIPVGEGNAVDYSVFFSSDVKGYGIIGKDRGSGRYDLLLVGAPVTNTIYWGIKDGELIIGSSVTETAGASENGTFSKEVVFTADTVPWRDSRESIQKVTVKGTVDPESTACWFYDLEQCTSMDLSGLDTANVTTMEMMFHGCANLTQLDVSGFDVTNVNSVDDMFALCTSLKELKIGDSVAELMRQHNTGLDKLYRIVDTCTATEFTAESAAGFSGLTAGTYAVSFIPEHEYDYSVVPDWNWTKQQDGYTASAVFSCKKNAEHKETREALVEADITQSPTCSAEGEKTYTATVTPPGYSYTDTRTEPIEKVPHSYGNEWKSDPASHWRECSCGAESEKAAHSFGAWTVTKQATESEEGLQERSCDICGYKETKAIPATTHTHSYGNEWKSDSANHWHECSCGAESEKAAHSFGAWTVTKQATESEEGLQERNCDICGYKDTEVIPKTGSGSSDSGKIETDKEQGENTPDAEFGTSKDDIINAVLTPEEISLVEAGTDIKITLVIDNIDDSVSQSDKQAVTDKAGEYKTGEYLDINLYKIIGADRTKISHTSGKIRIVLTIPDSLINTDSGTTRSYAVVRVHNGVADLLADMDDDEATITIETDLFSTYALVYKDKANTGGQNPDDGGSGSGDSGDNENGSGSGDSGDNGNGSGSGDSGDNGNGSGSGDSGDNGNSSGSGDSGDNGNGSGSGNGGNGNNSSDSGNNSNTGNGSQTADRKNDSEPKTGDTTPVEICATLTMISGFSYLVLLFGDRKRGMTEQEKKELTAALVAWGRKGGKLRKAAALAVIFLILVYYHSIGKRTCVNWKQVYGE